ncbi:MAG TPA: primosomal protein N', partial [Chitinophagaceae bacterium]
FRVNERAFQLMEQVSGRAGRKDNTGKVMIQVTNTYHPVLKFVEEHSFKNLYDHEIDNRKQFFYPPFSRLIQITFRHKLSNIAEEAANLMMQGLKTNYANYISGPAEPVVNRIRNQYLRELLIKLPRDAHFIQQCKKAVQQQTVIIQSNKRYRSVDIVIDVDPV